MKTGGVGPLSTNLAPLDQPCMHASGRPRGGHDAGPALPCREHFRMTVSAPRLRACLDSSLALAFQRDALSALTP